MMMPDHFSQKLSDSIESANVEEGKMSFDHDAMVAFIGHNADYYVDVFKRLDGTGKKMSWNWAAFFGGPIWALYRGVRSYSLTKHYIRFALNPLAYAMFGNWAYKQMMEEELTAVERLDPAEQLETLRQRGGITLSPFIFVGSLLALAAITYVWQEVLNL